MIKRTKQVIVIRKDLGMRRGKEIAQGSHASISFLTRPLKNTANENPDDWGNWAGYHEGILHLTPVQLSWIKESFAKVCVRVNSEEELMAVKAKAEEIGVECHLIQDSGKTEFGGVPTYTCLAVGPDWKERVDLVTGDLELY